MSTNLSIYSQAILGKLRKSNASPRIFCIPLDTKLSQDLIDPFAAGG